MKKYSVKDLRNIDLDKEIDYTLSKFIYLYHKLFKIKAHGSSNLFRALFIRGILFELEKNR